MSNKLEDDIRRVAAGGTVEDSEAHPADRLTTQEHRELYEWFILLMAKIPTCPKCGSDTCQENTLLYMERAYKTMVGPQSLIILLLALLERIGPEVRLTAAEMQRANHGQDWHIQHLVNRASGDVTMTLVKPGPAVEPQEDWPNTIPDPREEGL